MITLIGSSTNLLVSGILEDLGSDGFGFFDFTVPGLVVAGVGIIYVALIAPRLTPDRERPDLTPTSGGRQFVARISVTFGSKFEGLSPRGGFFPDLKDLTIKEVRRGPKTLTPPFDNSLVLTEGDLMVAAATRKVLTEALGAEASRMVLESAARNIDHDETGSSKTTPREQMIVEAMVRPTSRLVGMSLEMLGFRHRSHTMVLGIQRRARIINQQMSDFRLAAGDILLLQGRRQDIDALRDDPDLLLIEWSAATLPSVHHARRAVAIFLGVIVVATTGTFPIVTAALIGAVLMIATGVLNVRQAARAIDRTIVMLIATALALGTALQMTGGDMFIAEQFLRAAGGASPAIVLSAFFLLVAVLANIISAKATAVLFTPIAIGIANGLGVPPMPFAVAVIFAANCGFATPVAYQTNLLVMGPGHYRFMDFVRTGAPLVIIVWITFSLFAPWYYGL
jgi:di/tricarboxylate transporter